MTITSSGEIQIVGNDGTPNAISIGLSALQLTSEQHPSTPTTVTVNLPFNSIQSAAGQGTTASMVAYDSLGMPLSVNITAVLESVKPAVPPPTAGMPTAVKTTPAARKNIAVGTGTVSFDGEGNFLSASNTTVSIEQANEPS